MITIDTKKNKVIINNKEYDIDILIDYENLKKKYKGKYKLLNGDLVINERKFIRWHHGNSVRNFTDMKGIKWKKESCGCILCGMEYDDNNGLVYRSREALNILLDYIKDKNNEKINIVNNI